MKKLLIIAYDFPPYVSVAGLRPYSWYIYLKEYGVYPIVVTRQWNKKYGNELDFICESKTQKTIIEKTEFGTIIKTPYKPNLSNTLLLKYGDSKFKFLRKSITAYYEIMQYFLPIGTKYKLYKEAKKYLKQNTVDAIIATGEPFILFKYANKLSKKNNVPWFADYRDPWNPIINSNIIWQKIQIYFEKKYVKTAKNIITVSAFLKKTISKTIKNKKFIILPNGYNPNAIKETESIKQNNNILSIAFVGSILNWNPYESFLRCLNNFILEKKTNKIKLNFFGINKEKEINDLINDKFTQLKPFVTIYPKTPNAELLKKLSEYNVLLLFNHFSIAGTKIYDYLAIKRLILLCYSNDPEAMDLKEKYYPQKEVEGISNSLQEDIINETQSGIVAKDYNHLYQILENLYNEFQENGKIKCNSVNIEQFSRKYQVEKLANIVKDVN